VVFRLLGYIDQTRKELIESWTRLYPKVMICHRILHSPDGSYDYEKRTTKPETGVCLEMLHKLAIDRHGNVFPCVRFDPHLKNKLGNVDGRPLTDIWIHPIRKGWVRQHIEGRRNLVPLCKTCEFWGIAKG
jgi:radical SAM protein with 4Fe4S-binding SPASM domain